MGIHERLRIAREKIYESAADAARALGINYNTYVAHENGSRGFGRDAAMRYASKFNLSLEYLLTGKGANPTKTSPVTAISAKEGGMPVKGFVRAGSWQESYRPEGDKILPISKDLRYLGRDQFALEVQGESMNKQFRPGEYVVCVAWGGEPIHNEVVVVERNKNGMFEATIKTIKIISHSRVELWPDSTHPDYQTPYILLDGGDEDAEEISIVAKVIGVYRVV